MRPLKEIVKEFSLADLRWSYLASAGMIVVGIFVNIFLPQGWTVWPFVLAAGVMMMVNEAADRNASGIPPLHVYAFVAGAVVVWIGVVMLFTAVNPFILLIGMLSLGYYCTREYIKDRQRREQMMSRMIDGCCIHCGHPVQPDLAYCDHCGEEPNPTENQLKRVASTIHQRKRTAQARAALTPQSPIASVSQKEKALLGRRPRRGGRGRKY
jgi:Flp pilus assembly protein TadB